MQQYSPEYFFEDLPVIAKLPPHKAAAKLRELGDNETALAIENVLGEVKTATLLKENYELRSAGAELFSYQFEDFTNIVWTEPKAYQNTSHVFGYIAPPPDGGYKGQLVDINHAGTMKPHIGLKDQRIVITLDRLRVANYPGQGMHQILFDFYAQNQLKDNVEHLHFNQTFRAQHGNDVAVIGYPIFIGLNVGSQGINFKCFTVNVKNEDDEAILRFLDNDVFQAGLKLVNTIQPAIAPLTGFAVGLTKLIAGRNQNVPVQDFYMGLDFSNVPTRARLAEGSYLAVQVPQGYSTNWKWSDWAYNSDNGAIVNRRYPGTPFPYNYICIGVSKYDGS